MPTERQLLIHTLKSLGYIGDLRQGKLSDLKEFIQRYNHANKLGFNHAHYTEDLKVHLQPLDF
ncbi:hypothetical protein PROFUN_15382 [Planoprotostelium fungivorum]|uniref:Uncharacterized protein n=1 Tax=Planoprotostelium fungivorum TaxID=1890364 RepID=A0A2P6MVF3_9EUKA|nr:hypothetical protein PROFUN_15382 [Planoprotostelium fungivorum]